MSEHREHRSSSAAVPAGYTAALYTARANLNPLVIEGFAWGGLLQQTTDVENYPGFPEGIMGPEMMQKLREQAERFGARLLDRAGRARRARERARRAAPGVGRRDRVSGPHGGARDGRRAQEAGVPGEEELARPRRQLLRHLRRRLLQGAPTIIVGGGDSAMEEAIFLSKFASKVTVVHRRDEFRASKIMLERARAQANIELLTPYTVKEFVARRAGALGHADARATPRPARARELEIAGGFIASATSPSRSSSGPDRVDENGYVVDRGGSTRTNRPGVFAAGDLVDHTYRQAITAAGSGCQAALDAEWYLRDTPEVPTPAGMPMGDPRKRSGRPLADRAGRERDSLGIVEEAGAGQARPRRPAATRRRSAGAGR